MNPILLVVIPLIAAFLSILIKKYAHILLLLTSLAVTIISLFVTQGITNIGGDTPVYSIYFVVNSFTELSLLVVNGLLLFIYATNYVKFQKFAPVLLVILAGLNGLLLTADLFNLFVFMEIVAIAGYIITATQNAPSKTFSYLVQGSIGSTFYLLGLIILYNMTGTLSMHDVASQIQASNDSVSIPVLMMVIGLGVEIKILPLNNWVKGILETSNTLTGPLIASAYSATFLFVFTRVIQYIYIPSSTLTTILLVIFVASIVAGEAMAYDSKRVKHILLFSSIAQSGIVALLAIYGFVGVAAVFISVVAITKFILFAITNHIEEQAQTDEIEKLEGIFKQNILLGVFFTVAVLSMLGLPLFVGFIVKMNAMMSFFETGQYIIPVAILLTTIIEAIYLIKLLGVLWYGQNDLKIKLCPALYVILSILVISLIVFGLTSNVSDLIDKINLIDWMEV